MNRADRARRLRHHRRGHCVWCAAALFTGWVVLWRRPGEALDDMMILMYMLALACTVTLSVKITDHDAHCADREGERDASRADRIIQALEEMTDALTSERRPAAEARGSRGGAELRLRLVDPGREQREAEEAGGESATSPGP